MQQTGSEAEETRESENRIEEVQQSESEAEELQQNGSKAEELQQSGNAEEAKALSGNEAKSGISPDESGENTESAGAENSAGKQDSESTVTIVIQAGNSSDTVAKKLMSAGLVESAAEYDTYLCSRGYDKKICVGTFEIPKGSTEEEIAEIITKRR